MDYLEQLLVTACQSLYKLDVKPVLTRPEEQFGDFATNIAMQLAGQLKQPPFKIAEQLKDYLQTNSDQAITKVEVAKPGFLNISISDQALWQNTQTKANKTLKGFKVLLEYSCPNAFKELHAGHLYQTIVGDAIGVMLASAGAEVYRANFGGDVGLHAAKCIWGGQQILGNDSPAKLNDVPVAKRPAWLSKAYVKGATAYQDDPKAAEQIKQLNTAIYELHSQNDHDSPLAQIYWQCRTWSYDYFKEFYEQLDVSAFNKYYPESAVTPRGLEIVQANRGKVFADSDGAVIFKGEDFGQHTRVFITSRGLPTYETKDLGVIFTEVDDFAYTGRIIMTGNDQAEYMKVVFAALGQIDQTLAAKQVHLTNGTVRFADGRKMSSRLGNVLSASNVLTAVASSVETDNKTLHRQIMLGAVKYTFLKQRLGGDIAFDINESVSLQGNSGPYLQYAHARARSILAKAKPTKLKEARFEAGERTLVRKLGEYSTVVRQAIDELAPHLICTYLYELAQTFNRFYEQNRVIDDPRQDVRLTLVGLYANTLQSGLKMLNIPTPDHI